MVMDGLDRIGVIENSVVFIFLLKINRFMVK
jgi:hypothetical protein